MVRETSSTYEPWTELDVKAFTREQIDKNYYTTASAIVLKSNYVQKENTGWRFDKMRAVVEQEIKIYKQLIKK